jgi:trk system potassium uptake protein TrkH
VKASRFLPRTAHGALVSGFAALILAGALLLWLPCSHQAGRVGFVDALFTATSAVCVTGLIVVETGSAWTTFGQVVILVLIQAGGLGVMTVATIAFRIFRRRLSLTSQAAVQDSLLQRNSATEFRKLFRQILKITVAVEMAGAILIFVSIRDDLPTGAAIGSACFHSVSAFCNAGFSLNPDSLVGWRDSPLLLLTIMTLIVVGGLGHVAISEIAGRCRRGRAPRPSLSFHTRLVLFVSCALILVGWVGLGLLERPAGDLSTRDLVTGGLFQSVSARTAGFNTWDIGALTPAALALLVFLMFVGGSPGSCAGGVKTTTLTIWLASLWSRLRGRKTVRLLDRRVPRVLVERAGLLIGLAVMWNFFGFLLLLVTEYGGGGPGPGEVLFEQVSAFGTVGLSTGLTPGLTLGGKLWIVLTMFVGRLGPLTLATFGTRNGAPRVKYPEARILIG